MDTVKPASAAAPPDAPDISTPDTANWKPPISDELEYNTSSEDSVAAPNEILLAQLLPSPLHTPHSSYSPTQSSTSSQIPSASASSHGGSNGSSIQSPVAKSRPSPSGLDTTRPDKQPSASVTVTAKLVSTPEPAGIELPSNENPRIKAEPTDTVKPASSAAPPDAPYK